MKLFLLAAAAVIATPLAAQQQTNEGAQPTSAQPASSPDGTVPGQQGGRVNPASPSAGNGSMSGGSTTSGSMMSQSSSGSPMSTGNDPVGGYQPSAMSSPAPAGATVTYQQAPSPDQAYPAPAPMAKYPPCKPGQYDKCMQTGASRGHKMMHHTKHHAMKRKHK